MADVLDALHVTPVSDEAVTARTQSRLEQHRVALASAGINDVTALGTLTIEGPVLAQPGVTAAEPATPEAQQARAQALGADPELVDARRSSIYGPATIVEGVQRADGLDEQGRPKLVDLSEPARLLLATPAPQMALDTGYWAADTIELADDTTVVLRQPHKFLFVIARRLIVGKNVIFTWEKSAPAGGVPAKPPPRPPQGTFHNASGANGSDGLPGLLGVPGPQGKDAPELELWLLELQGRPGFVLDGQRGFDGAGGGDGGAAGGGSDGSAEKYDFFGFCAAGPGYGGTGGPGGPGGRGGDAGNGGHGGAIDIYAPAPVVLSLASGWYGVIDGGEAGQPGEGGKGGAGGASGPQGWCHRCCPPTRRDGGVGVAGNAGARGRPGTAGGTYDGSPGTRDGRTLNAIDEGDFLRELTNAGIHRVVPEWAVEGQQVTVEGVRFLPDDEVLLDGTAVATTYVDGEHLTFRVPVAEGGRHEVRVRRADGTASRSRGTLSVRPVLTGTDPAGRLTPGTTVTLTGSGFSRDARVSVNGEPMEVAGWESPTRLPFKLRRPLQPKEDSEGEPITIKVSLGTGEPSNEIAAVLDTFSIVVLGDSVAWGQGLREQEKYHSLVADHVAATRGGQRVYRTQLAHSGAVIRLAHDSPADPKGPIHGEVPTPRPTVLEQVTLYDGQHRKPRDPALVDLVLITASANDVDIADVLNPLTPAAEVARRVDDHCYWAMRALLAEVTKHYPNATVVVTGYYPIISERSDLGLLQAVLEAVGVSISLLLGLGLMLVDIKTRSVNNCRTFVERSALRLEAAVEHANLALGGGRRVRFALPAYSADNAMLAPDPWVFALNGDLSTQDPAVYPERALACRTFAGRTGLHCPLASVAHPNPRGAQAYAEAIRLALDGDTDPVASLPDFPQPFLWGAADSAYQVEGGIENNDWSLFTTSQAIKNRVRVIASVGQQDIELEPAGAALRHADLDVLRHDLELAGLLGFNTFRVSFEWSRLQPNRPGPGPFTEADFDAAALEYYDEVIGELTRRGLEPVVTLNHLSLPLWACTPPEKVVMVPMNPRPLPLPLADGTDAKFTASMRGWEGKDTIDAFVAFARFMAQRYRGTVRRWITLNEPAGSMIGLGYIGGVWPPGFNDGERAKRALFNLIRAHVRAYDEIKAVDPEAQVGVVHAMQHARVTAEQLTSVLGDPWAARNQFDYFCNWHFLNAILKGRIDRAIHRRTQNQDVVKPGELAQWFGYPIEDTQPWRRRADFVGLNYYRSVRVFYQLVVSAVAPFAGGGFVNNLHGHDEEPHYLLNDLGWEISPEGLYLMLTGLRDRYDVPVLITENGIPEATDRLRAPYITSHLQQVLRAMKEGVEVLGYLHWTFIDNWELHEGFRHESRFGLFTADLPDQPAGPRHITRGALAYQQVIADNGVDGAVERFGALAAGGDRVRPATRSAGRTYEETPDGDERFTLTLGQLASGELQGTMYYTEPKVWLRLHDVRWDPDAQRLRFEHAARPGSVPERIYDVAPKGRKLVGSYVAGGTTVAWEAALVVHAGTWVSRSEPFRIEIDRLEGAPGGWTAKYLSSGADAQWRHIKHVDSAGPTLDLHDEEGMHLFQGGIAGETLGGTVRVGTPDEAVWQAVRAPDGLPFAPGGAPPPPLRGASFAGHSAYTSAARTTSVDLTRLAPGQQAWVVVRAVNTGSATWRRTGAEATVLATDGPRGRTSALATAAWLSPSRPTGLKEDAVPTGAVGTFEFPVAAPATGGALEERFSVAAGKAWHAGAPLTLPVTVKAPQAGLAAALAAVQAFRDEARTEPVGLSGLSAGQAVWVEVRLLNTGSTTWRSTGPNPVQLRTDEPRDRPSVLVAPPWLSPSRPAALAEDAVPTGAVGTFAFPIIAPAEGGGFEERFRAAAGGLGWFQGDAVVLAGDVIPPPVPLARYASAPGEHAAYADATKTRSVDLKQLTPGQAVWLIVRAINLGAATWTRTGANPVVLGTEGPRDRASAIATPGWLSPSRPARLVEESVPTGATGTFEFAATAPSAGVLEERFRPVADPLAWLEGEDIRLHFSVGVPVAQQRVAVQARHRAPLEPGQSGGGPGSGALETAIQERLVAVLRADGRFAATTFAGDLPDAIDVDLGLFLSVDAAAKPTAGGYYFAYPQQPANRTLAELVAAEFATIPGRPNRRADNNPASLAAYFGFARLPAGAPKLLVQHGFVTKPEERDWIASHVDDLARAEYRAVCRFLGWEPRPETTKRVMIQARHQVPLEPGQSAGGPGSASFEVALQQRLLTLMRADGRFNAMPFTGDLPAGVDADLAVVLSVDSAANPQAGGYYFAYPDHAASKQLAQGLDAELGTIAGRPKRRADNNPPSLAQYFGFGRLPEKAAKVLVQHGFVTRPAELDWLNTNVDALARAEYRALCRHLGWEPIEAPA